MVAPWGGKLDHPDLVAGENDIIEILLVQLDNIASDILIRQSSIWNARAAIKLRAKF